MDWAEGVDLAEAGRAARSSSDNPAKDAEREGNALPKSEGVSRMDGAWRAAVDLISADVSLAVLGSASESRDPTLFGMGTKAARIDAKRTATLLSSIRRELFSTPMGDECCVLDAQCLESFAEGSGLPWLASYSSFGACRLEREDGLRFVALFLKRSAEGLPFDRQAVEQVSAILHHLVATRRHFLRLEQQRRLAWSSLHTLSMPIMIVDPEAHVRYANPAGEDLLSKNEVVGRDTEGRICTHRPATNRMVRELIAFGGRVPKDHICSIASDFGDRVVLLIRAFPADRSFDGGAVIAALSTRPADAPPHNALLESCGLLKSEARFLAALTRTGTLAEAAGKLGLSEETGRTYAKRAMSKLGLHNQFELGRMIGELRDPFRDLGALGTSTENAV